MTSIFIKTTYQDHMYMEDLINYYKHCNFIIMGDYNLAEVSWCIMGDYNLTEVSWCNNSFSFNNNKKLFKNRIIIIKYFTL